MAQILIFGASRECGAWDKEGGWVARLQKYNNERIIKDKYKDDTFVYNLGVDGDDSRGLAKRIKREATIRIWPNSETIFIISIGTNDTIYSNKSKRLRVSPREYKANLIKITNITKRYAGKTIFISPLTVDDKKVSPIPWLEGYSYIDKFVKQYLQIMREVARIKKVEFINIRNIISKSAWLKLMPDGVHLNSVGHEKIFQRVKKFLLNNKVI